jgi:hypothetical protein
VAEQTWNTLRSTGKKNGRSHTGRLVGLEMLVKEANKVKVVVVSTLHEFI